MTIEYGVGQEPRNSDIATAHSEALSPDADLDGAVSTAMEIFTNEDHFHTDFDPETGLVFSDSAEKAGLRGRLQMSLSDWATMYFPEARTNNTTFRDKFVAGVYSRVNAIATEEASANI